MFLGEKDLRFFGSRRETLQSERDFSLSANPGGTPRRGFFHNSPGLPGPVLAMTYPGKPPWGEASLALWRIIEKTCSNGWMKGFCIERGWNLVIRHFLTL